MIIAPFLFVAAQLLPAPDSVQWEFLLGDGEGNRLFIDPASLTQEGDVVRFMARLEGSPQRPVGTRLMIIRAAIDCRLHAVAFLIGDSYGEGGRHIASRQVQPSEITFEPVGEDMAVFYTRVCRAPTH